MHQKSKNPKIKIKKQTNAYRKKSSGQKFPTNLIHTKKTFKELTTPLISMTLIMEKN